MTIIRFSWLIENNLLIDAYNNTYEQLHKARAVPCGNSTTPDHPLR